MSTEGLLSHLIDEDRSTQSIDESSLLLDPDQEAVYNAEEFWLYEADDLGLIDAEQERLLPEAVSDFAANVMARAGWEPEHPTIRFDVPDDSPRAGWVGGQDGEIHLHPRLLSRTIILHELSHWLDRRDRHGPIYQGNMVSLVEAEFGAPAAQLLYDHYSERELAPDPWGLPETLPITDALRRKRSLEPSMGAATWTEGGGA